MVSYNIAMDLPKLIEDFLEYLEIEKNCSRLTIRDYRHYLRIFNEWYATTGKSIKDLDLATVVLGAAFCFERTSLA